VNEERACECVIESQERSHAENQRQQL
jgi:hypothetical protein